VLRETTSRGLRGLVCPSRTSELLNAGCYLVSKTDLLGQGRECDVYTFTGTHFSNLYTTVDTPVRGRVGP
jgi:hypothetical protein